jgi:filamentous hemagglutinin family protein
MKSTAGPARAYCFYLLVTAFFLASLLLLSPVIPTDNRAHAAAPITPSGLNTQVTLSATPPAGTTQYDITGGTRPGGGANLFHSFGDFSVPTNNIANFLNTGSVDLAGNPLPAGLATSNILGRVTGGHISDIFGTLQTTGFGNANLFLMNPAGFLFGLNATVNVGGMMTFTTADYMRLRGLDGSNAGILHADTAQTSILTSAPVAAFGFIGSNPHSIDFIGGQLTVAEGTGLVLVGGDINLIPDPSGTPSSITAPGRPIQMTSVAGPGEVVADTGIPAAGMALGAITLGQGSILSTAGDSSFGDGSGGAVSIRGGQFVTTGAQILTNPAFDSTGQGGAVRITASDTASFIDSTINTSSSFFAGSAGAVSVIANDSLEMTNTTINTSAIFAGGDGGPVTLRTNGLLSLTDSFISTQASAPGNGGAVTMTGKDVTLNNSSMFTLVNTGFFDLTIDDPALGLVHPGAVTITAENTVSISGSFVPGIVPTINASAFGTLVDAGPVTIAGKTVNLSNGTIDVSMQEGSFPSPGNGGAIEIRGNNVNLSQFTVQSENLGLTASTGKGGSILLRGTDNLRADNIQLANSAINVDSVSGGGGGNIEFQTQALTLSDTRVSADTAGIGPGGSIAVHGAQTVILQSNSVVDASAINTGEGIPGPFGAAGTIVLETEQLTMQGGSALKAADLPLSQGNAGSITVRGTNGPAQSILIDGAGTGIFTDAEGNGAGGDINLFANSIMLQNGGTISATTSGTDATATGGTITVEAANTVSMASGASINASSTGAADAGSINITAMNGFTMQNSTVRTLAGQGAGGGNIKVTTSPEATVLLQDSLISASVADGHGGGGNISIDPQFVILQNSQILAQAAQGQGGAITITAGLFLSDANSIVNADSGSGTNGTVTIQSPNAPISGQIQPLGKSPLLATSLLNQHCAALAGGEFSSFTVAGRDSLPTEPGSWLASPLAFGSAGFSAGAVTERGAQARVIDPAQEMTVLSLRQIAPAGFLTQAFAVDQSASCQS